MRSFAFAFTLTYFIKMSETNSARNLKTILDKTLKDRRQAYTSAEVDALEALNKRIAFTNSTCKFWDVRSGCIYETVLKFCLNLW